MESKVFTVKIAGQAGFGIKSGGQLLSKIITSHGFTFSDYNEYPSLVRGGHNTYQLTFSRDQVFAPHYFVDLLISVSPNHHLPHLEELTPASIVLHDDDLKDEPKAAYLRLPMTSIADELGTLILKNTICLGAAVYLLGLDFDISLNVIKDHFSSDSSLNLKAFNAGYKFAQDNFSQSVLSPVQKIQKTNTLEIADGNEAFARGFVDGGGKFYAAYPMTPATGALHYLALHQNKLNITVVHPEDEIAAANMAVGASFAGSPGAVGTSGGGYALMNEAISFAGVSEIGTVFYLVSRPGPATGMPTWTSQGDLMHAIYSGHGEFPKIVLAPGDQLESYELGVDAVRLSQYVQTPVVVVSDKFLAESSSSIKSENKYVSKIPETKKADSLVSGQFSRYSLEDKDGISPLAYPGEPNGQYLANSYEHDEKGFSTEDASTAQKMVLKRAKKLESVKKLLPKPNFYGSPSANKLLISWGSNKSVILEALSMLPNREEYAFLQLKTLWPINPDLKLLIDPFTTVIVIENNSTGQLTTLLKSQFDFSPDKQILKFNGRPFYPEELYEQLK